MWRLATGGGEAEQVTRLPLDLEAFQVGPTGDALYVAMAVFPDCAEPIPCTVERVAAEDARKSSGRIYDRLFVRHWDSWEDGRRNHVFRIPLGPDGLVTGEPRDLMPGVDADCPTTPFGDASDWTVSPDGDWLVYTAKVVAGSEEAWSTDYDLWAVPSDGSAPARCLTDANPAWDSSPGVLARRHAPRLPRNGPSRLRGRPPPRGDAGLAGRRCARPHRVLGPLRGQPCLVGGQPPAGDRRRQRRRRRRSSRSTPRPAP